MILKHRQVRAIIRAALLVAFIALITACDTSGVPLPTGTPVVVATATQDASATPANQEGLETVEATAQATQPSVSATGVPTIQATRLPSPEATPGGMLMPLRERTAQFNEVWSTVREHYLYTDFRGVDWDEIRIEYALKVAEAKSAPEFYKLISEMVGLLKDQHSRYISPQVAHDEDDLNRGDASYAGVGILSKYEDKSALIILVFPGSPAESAGLERRDRILAVDGKPMTDGEQTGIRGPIGTDVRLTVQSPGEKERDVTLTRRAVTGKITASSERLEIDKSIGYLLIPSLWADDMAEQVEEQLGELVAGSPLKGLVIDLRANEGGWRPVLTGILSQLVQGDVGRFYSQESSYPLDIIQGSLYPRLKDMPLVVLVDDESQSYAEVLAGALQAAGRAKVVGKKSAGNTETIYSYNFPDGSRLWVAQEGYKLQDGTNMEGRGVIPDVSIDVDWTQYSLTADPHVLKAVELLTK